MPSIRPRSIVRLAAMAALGLGLAGCVSNSDAMYGSDGDAPDVALVKNVMKSLGAVDPDEKPIDYKPRAPLAMPGDAKDLPSPESAEAKPANWPRNRDAELAEIQRANDTRDATAEATGRTGNPILGIEDIKKGTVVGHDANRMTEAQRKDVWDSKHPRLTIDEMKGHDGPTRADTQSLFDASGKPQRRYLVEPPVAYSTPAETAAMPDVKTIESDADKPRDDSIDHYDPKLEKID